MTMPTRISGYPSAFMMIVSDELPDAAPVEIKLGPKRAYSLQMQWYGFLRALDKRAREEAPEKDEHGHLRYPWAEIAERARTIKVTVDKAKGTFTMVSREYTEVGRDADELLQAIRNTKVT